MWQNLDFRGQRLKYGSVEFVIPFKILGLPFLIKTYVYCSGIMNILAASRN